MIKKNQDYYSKNAALLGWGEKEAKIDNQRVELLNKYLTGKEILDIGCATGIYVDFLSKKDLAVTGIDLVKEFVTRAKSSKQGEFIVGSADKLPFKDKSFDSLYIFDLLEHGDDLKILTEAKRVARQRILVIVPRIVDPRLANSGVIFRHYLDKSHLREYSEEMIRELAKKSGLKLLHIEKIHPLFNETVFMALFNGNNLVKKIIRKIVLILLPVEKYYTEYFAVLVKN